MNLPQIQRADTEVSSLTAGGTYSLGPTGVGEFSTWNLLRPTQIDRKEKDKCIFKNLRDIKRCAQKKMTNLNKYPFLLILSSKPVSLHHSGPPSPSYTSAINQTCCVLLCKYGKPLSSASLSEELYKIKETNSTTLWKAACMCMFVGARETMLRVRVYTCERLYVLA